MSGDQKKCMELIEAKEYGLLALELSPDAARILEKVNPVFKKVVARNLVRKMHDDDPIPYSYKVMLLYDNQ